MRGLAGLGALAGGAAQGFVQGKQLGWQNDDAAYRKEQRERDKRLQADQDAERELMKQANAAATTLPGWSQLQPGQQPPPELLSQAYNARGEVFRAGGRGDLMMKNWAEALPYHTAVRSKAIDQGLQQYGADGDAIKLAQSVYPLVNDGKSITMAKKREDGAIEFSLSDGKKFVSNPEQLVQYLQRARMDPKVLAELEYKKLVADAEAAKQIKVERVKGEEARTTEAQKAGSARELADLQHDYSLTLEDARGKRAEKVANIGAGATRYSADQRVKAAEVSADRPKSGGKVDWSGLAGKHYGETQMGLLGGSRSASPKTLALAVSAQEIFEANKDKAGMTPEKAIELAAKQHGAR